MHLAEKKCVPCEQGGAPLTEQEIAQHTPHIHMAWDVIDQKMLSRAFDDFADFKAAMIFVNKVADIAESEAHHPDIHIHYNKVLIELWTHAVDGLSENDFILAAKIDAIGA